jgi:hypothetical protein
MLLFANLGLCITIPISHNFVVITIILQSFLNILAVACDERAEKKCGFCVYNESLSLACPRLREKRDFTPQTEPIAEGGTDKKRKGNWII